MSVQIFLQGKLIGIDEFVLAPATGDEERVFAGRSQWITLLSEVLPRALLAELGLARILLGTSGGGQFLLVLPGEARSQAEEFLERAAAEIARMSGSRVRIVWSITENLGDWTVVRRRLFEGLERKEGAPAAASGNEAFAAPISADELADEYFGEELGLKLRDASSVGWSPEAPATIVTGAGKHTWSLSESMDGLSLARHTAPSDDGVRPAGRQTLASRASGRSIWGVLRGDVDNFGIRIRRAQSIEEHIQLSVMLKQFFAGELEVLCSMGEYWRKVTILYSGGDDFAVYGSWDALIPLAREIQRLLNRLSEEGMKDFAGREGKTVTMAMSLAPDPDASLAEVYEEAGAKLEVAKSTDKDCFALLGRTLEWKQLSDAAELKDELTRMITEFGCEPQYLGDLCGLYRETHWARRGRDTDSPASRPWRFHRRLNRILGAARGREFQKARTSLIADLAGRNTANLKLRPSGRVALEWARLST
jgi:CRISPR-associated protein Csm1